MSVTGLSIKTLHDLFGQVALAQPSVESFGSGEREGISVDGNSESVHVWLEQPIMIDTTIPAGGRPAVRVFRVQFLVLDLPLRDESDTLDVISRCDIIATSIVVGLIADNRVTLRDSVNTMTLRSYHGDLWAGVRVQMQIESPMPIGKCDAQSFVQ